MSKSEALEKLYSDAHREWAESSINKLYDQIEFIETKFKIRDLAIDCGMGQLVTILSAANILLIKAEIKWLEQQIQEVSRGYDELKKMLEGADDLVQDNAIQTTVDCIGALATILSGPFAPFVGLGAALLSTGVSIYLETDDYKTTINNANAAYTGFLDGKVHKHSKNLGLSITVISIAMDLDSLNQSMKDRELTKIKVKELANKIDNTIRQIIKKS